MLKLFYSPHMTSIDNEAKRASGHADVPLSEAGQQARQLGEHYAAEKLYVVFCSDLQRALHTAQLAFADRGVPILPDARLREYDYGDMTRDPVALVEKEFPYRVIVPFPNGESLQMVIERVGAFLHDVRAKYDGKTVVIIGHRATRYGLEYWCRRIDLETIVNTPWLEVPIWRYEI